MTDVASVPVDLAERALAAAAPLTRSEVEIEVVVPVFNEERDLASSVARLDAYLDATLPFTFRITVADNASTDGTWAIAQALARRLPRVHAVHLETKGRGRALHAVWSQSDAAVLAYMDVDLSTDLSALLPLVAPLVSGHSDVAIGTRLAPNARVVRGAKRELISRCYNALLHATLSARFSDAQCGFKAIRADRARMLLPYVEDTGWFFDTELLILAERAGMRIHEVPVDWVDDPDSSVDIVATAVADLKGVARLAGALVRGRLPFAGALEDGAPSAGPGGASTPGLAAQVARFSLIGAASTLAYVILYVLLRRGLPALTANGLSLLVTALLNTAVNRRVTFGVRGRAAHVRHQLQGLVIFAVGLALTSGALLTLHDLAPGAGRAWEVAVLVSAGAAATVVRFCLFRSWVFPGRPRRPDTIPVDTRRAR